MIKKIRINKKDLEYPDCPVCSNNKRRIIINTKPFSLALCTSCGLHYVYPRLTEKRGIKIYEKMYLKESISNLQTRFSDCSRFMWNIGKLIPYLDRKKESLIIYDLGSRGGGFVHLANYIIGQATGFDLTPSVKALKATKLSYLNIKEIKDVNKYPKADILSCLHVLEHLYKPKEFLENIVKPKIKEGGIVIFEVPNWGSKKAQRQLASWGWYQPWAHIIQFTSQPLIYLLKSAGFSILEVYEDYPPTVNSASDLSIKTLSAIIGSKILNHTGFKIKNYKGDMLGIIATKK